MPAGAPFWAVRATPGLAFRRGLTVALNIPGLILFASCAGFGALARDAGFSLANSLLMMAAMFALPAQVVLTDQLARGGSLMAGALAVTLTGIRMLPMVVTLMPYLRAERRPGWRTFVAVHTIAITAWIEGFRRLPQLPEALRLPHFLGIGVGLVSIAVLGTGVGYEVAGVLPKVLAATLLFLTPIYFILSLLATAGVAADRLAIGVGCLLGPLFFKLTPGFDLALTGLVGGTLAHVLAKRWRSGIVLHDDEDGGGP